MSSRSSSGTGVAAWIVRACSTRTVHALPNHHRSPSFTVIHHRLPSFTIVHRRSPSFTVVQSIVQSIAHRRSPSFTIVHRRSACALQITMLIFQTWRSKTTVLALMLDGLRSLQRLVLSMKPTQDCRHGILQGKHGKLQSTLAHVLVCSIVVQD